MHSDWDLLEQKSLLSLETRGHATAQHVQEISRWRAQSTEIFYSYKLSDVIGLKFNEFVHLFLIHTFISRTRLTCCCNNVWICHHPDHSRVPNPGLPSFPVNQWEPIWWLAITARQTRQIFGGWNIPAKLTDRQMTSLRARCLAD